VAAQLLGDRLHLARRNALHIHLRQGGDERPLGALVALEQLGGEAAVAILRNPELQLADAGNQRAPVRAGAVAKPLDRALALLGAQRLGHLRFQHLLHDGPNHLPQPIRIMQQKLFDGGAGGPTLSLGHGGVPSRESVTLNITSLP
jgi:hypothetical protein